MLSSLVLQRPRRASPLVAIVLLAVALLLPRPALAAAGSVRDFRVPTEGAHPGGITIGPDGAVWFTELATGKIGRKGPGGITEFRIPSGGLPWSIVPGPDGALWFTEYSTDEIGRITTSGSITEFDLGTCGGACQDIGPTDIAAGPDGALWFAEYEGHGIGRITTDGAFTQFPLLASQGDATSIAVGPDGALWFGDEQGIGRITTGGAVSQVWSGGGYADALTMGPDGNVWFIGSTDVVGRFRPATRKAKLFPLDLNCFPQEIEAASGDLWVTCYFLDEVERITTRAAISAVPVPNHFGGNYPDTLEGVAAGPGHTVWFTEEAANRIGRIDTR